MNSLGRSYSLHQGTLGAGGWFWYLGAVLVASGVLGVGRGVLAIAAHGDASPLSMGLVSLALVPAVLAMPVLRWRQSLELFEGGIVWRRLWGTRVITRSELGSVTHVQHYGRMGNYIELRLQLRDGRELSISGVDRADQAANLIAQLGAAPQAQPTQTSGSVR
jgi:hypothetical protein